MKKWIFLFFLVICAIFVSADTAKVTLEKGQGIVIDGRNVTLLRYSDSERKAVFCINNHRYIFEEDQPNIVNNLRVELTRIRPENVDVTLKGIQLAGTECTEECDNSKCMTSEQAEEEAVTEPQEGEIPEITPQENQSSTPSTIISGKTNIYIVIFLVILIILIIIAAILVFKRV